MLIITMKQEDVVQIGDNITIKLLRVERRVDGLAARLGIQAPREIPINREEVLRRNQVAEEKKE